MEDTIEKYTRRAVILLSGGLDSTLAARMLVDQGIDLHAIHFTSPFCTCARGNGHGAGCHSQARIVADEMNIPIRTVGKGQDYLDLVRKPRHGRGSGMNPCIDCRVFTLRKAREFMEEIGASFLVTGEVIGQRPMSQRQDALRLIEKHSGCVGIVLRPLSARHFEPTLPEREGWVDREKLLGITGRSRKEQFALAEQMGIVDFPCPAGGCMLTDPAFSIKVRDLLAHSEDATMADVNLLKVGRHFRMPDGRKVIVAQDEAANQRLETLCGAFPEGRSPFPTVFATEVEPGPSIAVFGTAGEDLPLGLLAKIYSRYCKPGAPFPLRVRLLSPGPSMEILVPRDDDHSALRDSLLCR